MERSKLSQPHTHGRRDGSTHAGVDLVEDEDRDTIRLGQDGF